VVDVVEEFGDVGSPNIAFTVFSQQFLGSGQAGVQAFALTARPNVRVKTSVIKLYQVVIEQSVHHPVSNRCYCQITALLFSQNDHLIAAMMVSPASQLRGQLCHLCF